MDNLISDICEAYYVYNMLWGELGPTNRDKKTGHSIPIQLKRMGFKASPTLCDENHLTPEGLNYYNELVNRWETKKYNEDGTPALIVCFDSGDSCWDRYSVIFMGHYDMGGNSLYLGMSSCPYNPQGFCQHGEVGGQFSPEDKEWVEENFSDWGKIISFYDLPDQCKELVMAVYKDIWG
jgi:hypothetical protein